jgi:hypothetical protein
MATSLGVVSIVGTLLLVAGVAAAAPHTASVFKLHAPIVLTDLYPTAGADFGGPVAAAGHCVAVGVPFNGTGGVFEAGAVNLYTSTGRLVASLGSPNPVADGGFGIALAMTTTTLVIGSLYETSQGVQYAGTAYVYSLSSTCAPTYRVELLEPSPQSFGRFGSAVGVSGPYAIIGAPEETASGVGSAGNAYLFATNGNYVTSFTSPSPQYFGNFGSSVALRGSTAYIGAPGESVGGHVYMIKRATTPALSSGMYVLTSPNAEPSGDFGGSLAVAGHLLIIGAVGESDSGASGSGNAYAFNASTGVYWYNVTNPTPAPSGGFGLSVAVSGSYIVVGAPGGGAGGNVTVYDASNGSEVAVLQAPYLQANADFGSDVAVGGATIVVGAVSETVDGDTGAGQAYIF